MKYQLVLQWPASSMDDYDAMIAIEDSLIDGLPDDCDVDGHDVGSGQVNVFILTDEPAKTFEDVRRILQGDEVWPSVRAGYRDLEKEDYRALWPDGLQRFELL